MIQSEVLTAQVRQSVSIKCQQLADLVGGSVSIKYRRQGSTRRSSARVYMRLFLSLVPESLDACVTWDDSHSSDDWFPGAEVTKEWAFLLARVLRRCMWHCGWSASRWLEFESSAQWTLVTSELGQSGTDRYVRDSQDETGSRLGRRSSIWFSYGYHLQPAAWRKLPQIKHSTKTCSLLDVLAGTSLTLEASLEIFDEKSFH